MTRRLLQLVWLLLPLLASAAPPAADTPLWFSAEGRVILHFFWSSRCPHCQAAKPVVERIAQSHRDWLELRAYQVDGNAANIRRYVEMAGALGEDARSVPAFLFCGAMQVGYTDGPTGERGLLEALEQCRDGYRPTAGPLQLPGVGRIDPAHWSLPLLTITIAALDAFNPCAFFVLLFLLSLLIHLKSRRRMALVGGLFVATSGLLYFLFMAAWLNLFLWAGELRWATLAAGVLALLIAALNIKDFYTPALGPSLSMDETHKGRLFQRIRRLVGHSRWPALIAATMLLAVAANSYELLCTAGFPMAYTRILTLQGLEPAAYYGYLALYNLIYVVPLAAITAAFTWKMGSRKLSEREGRLLKLAAGSMMGTLGGALLLAPELLSGPLGAMGLIAAALGFTALLALVERRTRRVAGEHGDGR
ncbi:thioredoxin family protein [Endothiovibrio diazotrophicus]